MDRRVFLTGASGNMGSKGLTELLKDSENKIITLVLPTEKDREAMKPYENNPRVEIHWGDLTNYDDVKKCVINADIVLHVGALVSPAADYFPEMTMKVNYGSTVNIIRAIKEETDPDKVRLVFIGTIAETGDRLPPIHWGRVGDPIAPSVHDYYAVSKVAAERAVIESGLKHWVSLRQTGILSKKMADTEDSIIFHQCLDNVLEYVTDKDSGVLLRNICKDLPEDFWCHIYNIGGGPACRISCFNLFKEMLGRIGIKQLDLALDSSWFATRNFHGQYYLDSDKLNNYLHFRSGDLEYFYKLYFDKLGFTGRLSRIITKLPGGQHFIGSIMRKRFSKLTLGKRGTMSFIKQKRYDYINPLFISEEKWKAIPQMREFKHFEDWEKVVHIDHGYDESKPVSLLNLEDIKGAAKFRGGDCLSSSMVKGDMKTKLTFNCAFGHEFEASPRLILEGGHWCPQCERESWNYNETAKVSPFFAQLWYALHDKNEPSGKYRKIVSELDI